MFLTDFTAFTFSYSFNEKLKNCYRYQFKEYTKKNLYQIKQFIKTRFSLGTCLSRRAPNNGAYVGQMKATWLANDRARFICDAGYELYGSASSTCRSTGEWDSDIPMCRRKHLIVKIYAYHLQSLFIIVV